MVGSFKETEPSHCFFCYRFQGPIHGKEAEVPVDGCLLRGFQGNRAGGETKTGYRREQVPPGMQLTGRPEDGGQEVARVGHPTAKMIV